MYRLHTIHTGRVPSDLIILTIYDAMDVARDMKLGKVGEIQKTNYYVPAL